jgi:type IV pilus assembly protein PilW
MSAIRREIPASGRQSGLSLVELMIALVLGLFIIAAVIQVFTSSRLTYTMSDGLARAQENARFAMEIINRDLRMAGGSAICAGTPIEPTVWVDPAVMPEVADLLAGQMALRGWDYGDSGTNDDFDLDTSIDFGQAGDWSDGQSGLPEFLQGRALIGSDILAIRGMEAADPDLTGCNNNNINSANIGTCSRANDGDVPAVAHGIAQGELWAVADCYAGMMDICRQTNAGSATNLNCAAGGGNIGKGGDHWDILYANQTEVYRPEVTYFYVGESQRTAGRRALFRAVNCYGNDVNAGCRIEELVEGVDSLQLFFRVDGNSTLHAADSIPGNEWEQVRAVAVNVIVSSSTEVDARVQEQVYPLDAGLTVSVEDRRVREVYSNTVAVRNRIRVH